MSKDGFHIITNPVYPFDVMVCFNKSYEDIRKKLLKVLPDEAKDGIALFENIKDGRTVMSRTGQTFICLNRITHKTIAHESFHAVELIFNRIGMKLGEKSSEAYAYFIGFLTEEIYKLNPPFNETGVCI